MNQTFKTNLLKKSIWGNPDGSAEDMRFIKIRFKNPLYPEREMSQEELSLITTLRRLGDNIEYASYSGVNHPA